MDEAFVIDKAQLRRSFDKAAATYDQAAVLQREVGDRMLERLQYIKIAPEMLLDAGCGTGYGTRQLLAQYPGTDLIAFDLAPAMLRAARGHAPRWKRSLQWLGGVRERYLCGDVEALPLRAASVDMVWSNLTLQWCNQLENAFDEFHRVLAPGGLLMFSTFGPDTLRELRDSFSRLDRHTHVNRFLDMHDIGDMLARAGFATPVMDMEQITLTYPDALSVMRDLKAIGAHNVTAGRRHGLTGKGELQALQRNYEQFRRDGKLPATYEVVYGHAWKPPESQRSDGAQVVKVNFKLNKHG
jgi:malonyl-CoA O-methyltransferase